jgi:hypothetical protein
MNCDEFLWTVNERLNFKIHIAFGVEPGYTGDIYFILKKPDKRIMVCSKGALIGPRFRDAFCNRWTIWFPSYTSNGVFHGCFDVSRISPPISADSFEFGVEQSFKPWDPEDPFYARALDVWDAKPPDQISFYFFIGDKYYVLFEEAKDGELGGIFLAGSDPLLQIGDATLTLQKI